MKNCSCNSCKQTIRIMYEKQEKQQHMHDLQHGKINIVPLSTEVKPAYHSTTEGLLIEYKPRIVKYKPKRDLKTGQFVSKKPNNKKKTLKFKW